MSIKIIPTTSVEILYPDGYKLNGDINKVIDTITREINDVKNDIKSCNDELNFYENTLKELLKIKETHE